MKPRDDQAAGGSDSVDSVSPSDQTASTAPTMHIPGVDDLSKESADSETDNAPIPESVSAEPADSAWLGKLTNGGNDNDNGAVPTPVPSPPEPEPHMPFAPITSGGRRRKKKLFWLAGGIGAGLLLVATGAYFGFYLPNTPDSVWKTGLNRSGDALAQLVESATADDELKAYQKTLNLKGSIDVKTDDVTYSGSFDTTAGDSSSKTGIKTTLDANGDKWKLDADVLTRLPKGGVIPDIYFRLSGFSDLGLDAYVPGINAYDDQWIEISSDYLKSVGGEYLGEEALNDAAAEQPTAKEMAELARVSVNTTRDYLFTTDPDKAIFVQKSFVGKETSDGMAVYHYKVGINDTHAEAYCVALQKAMLDTKAYQKLSGQTDKEIADEKKTVVDDCKTTDGDTVQNKEEYDLWIDKHYKLVHKIRVTNHESPNTYVDFGQTYKGGNKLALFANYHDGDDKYDGRLTLDIDLDKHNSQAVFTLKSSGDTKMDLRATLEAAFSNDPVDITPPENALPIETVYAGLGMSDPFVGIQDRARDTERVTDISAMTSHIEAYYAGHGFYPTLAQMNDANWRSENLRGLDPEAFAPAGSGSDKLAASATATQYGYATTGCTASGCSDYTLAALLSDGTVYSRSSQE